MKSIFIKVTIQKFKSFTMAKYILAFVLLANTNISAQTNDMMIRISEIEIDSNFLQEYKNILQEESRASVQLESGVIAIYPMCQKESPTKIRILEIYENRKAYESHLKTP